VCAFLVILAGTDVTKVIIQSSRVAYKRGSLKCQGWDGVWKEPLAVDSLNAAHILLTQTANQNPADQLSVLMDRARTLFQVQEFSLVEPSEDD